MSEVIEKVRKLAPSFTAKGIEGKCDDGYHADPKCPGLYLYVRGNSRTWQIRYTLAGKANYVALGSIQAVGLGEARTQATTLRQQAKAGQDIKAARKPVQAAAAPNSFQQDSMVFWDYSKGKWCAAHARLWLQAMERHVFPVIGNLDTARISVNDVVACLKPLWFDHFKTAIRMKIQIKQVIDFASEQDESRFTTRNPAGRKRIVHPDLPEGEHVKLDDTPHPAIDWQEAPALYKRLAEMDCQAAKALQFLLLCGTPRTNEIVGAKWSEIQGEAFHVPGERLKARKGTKKRKEGRIVPLTQPALDLLASLPFPKDGYLFTGRKGKTVGATAYYGRTRIAIGGTFVPFSGGMHHDAMQNLLRDMGVDCHVHGLRATFKTWAKENTLLPDDRETVEACLSHEMGTKAERAYDRSFMMPQRKALQERWAQYLAG